ncbi:MAG: hypothetical protein BGO43_01070 [Gammaproteobacteria bacterium 39-13]|nr:class I poly(R)-hydroxyalkanoic acid synthase [Gammaproteobacteria bacterium]OJV85592.1 MAG: hypothetical protein BGO43_01070 [Gammaproteobacteria bacterium 39-13]
MQGSKDTTQSLLFEQLNQTSLEMMKSYLDACQTVAKYNKIPELNWQEMFDVEHVYKYWVGEINDNKKSNIFEMQADFFKDFSDLCQSFQSMLLEEKFSPIIEPEKTDKRFRSADWHEKPFFFFLQQTYLLFVQHCLGFVEKNASHNPKIARQISFFTRQYLDALSPTNYFFTNPDVLRATFSTKGENLVQGAKHFWDDITRGKGHWSISMTDMSAFEVGKDIAITPGKVIFQNRMLQLIQYSPTTEKVYQKPLLIVPPWINKFYILDMRERNSFVKWAIEQGFTVFMISWVNPDKSYTDVSFEHYIFEGILAALDAISQATNEKSVNVLGFCIGGTLLASTLAYMKAKGDKRIASATFLTTLIDFSDPGEIEVFIDENQISALEKRMEVEGVLDGRLLMTTFNLLRANDLFWPYYINNYLCGQNPFAFDLLYWNCDSANLPRKMVSYFIRNMYMENRLTQPGGLVVDDVRLDIENVDVPSYFLSTEQDHIAPWETTFIGAQYFSGPVTFVLGGSGHIAGIVNPPANHKYAYRSAPLDVKKYVDSRAWHDNSEVHEGSWWEHWANWIKPYAGDLCSARVPGEGDLPVLQDAPGDYVKKRLL